jgi:hypothetical protein
VGRLSHMMCRSGKARDGLKAATVRRVARYNIPGATWKNWRNVLRSTAYPESKDKGGQEPADNAIIT